MCVKWKENRWYRYAELKIMDCHSPFSDTFQCIVASLVGINSLYIFSGEATGIV